MNSGQHSKKGHVAIALICLAGFIINYAAYYPGFITPDGLDQYQQSLNGKYEDWHPPLMAYMWHVFNLFYKGVEVMLIYQLGCLWLSGYFLMSAVRNKYWYAGIILLLFAPFVQNYSGCILKDSQMGLSWLLGCSILFNMLARHKRIPLTVAIVTGLLLLYGCWVRVNAFSGVVPLLLFWAWAVVREKRTRPIIIVFSGIVTVAIVGLWLFSGRIFHAKQMFAENKLYLQDLTSIYVSSNDNVFPDVLYTNPKFDTAYLRYKHHPATFDQIWWNNDGKTLLPDTNAVVTNRVKKAWESAIIKHPGVYLKQRYYGFLYFLRIRVKDKESDYMPYFPWVQPNDLGIEKKWTGLTATFINPIAYQKDMFYMSGYFWFFLNIVLVPALVFMRKDIFRTVYAALTLSGLFYILPQFFIFQVDADFRYFYWNCIACTLSLFVLIVAKHQQHLDNKKGGI